MRAMEPNLGLASVRRDNNNELVAAELTRLGCTVANCKLTAGRLERLHRKEAAECNDAEILSTRLNAIAHILADEYF